MAATIIYPSLPGRASANGSIHPLGDRYNVLPRIVKTLGHGPPHRGETATILYPGAPLKLQPFCYSGDRYNILPALLRARHGNYNLFFKKGSHRLNWQFARPIRRNFRHPQ